MAKDNDITIILQGKTHHFSQGDIESFKALPWSERKQLIELLEDIKQAEYVKKTTETEVIDKPDFLPEKKAVNGAPVGSASSPRPASHRPIESQEDAGLDASVKKSDQDVDELMQRLIIQEKQHHTPIPDRSSVVKLILGVFVLILILAVMF